MNNNNPVISVVGVDGQEMDKYTAGIELSNTCRNVYVSRLQAAESVRKKLLCDAIDGNENGVNPQSPHRRKTSIDEAMEILKREMVSLIFL